MQLPFLTALFQAAKKEGIHTCLDTSGIMFRRERRQEYEKLFQVLDLVLLDLKHSDEAEHKKLTGQSQKHILEFAGALEEAGIPMVVRHVIVPGITDGEEHLAGLEEYLRTLQHIQRVELLPYHTLGVHKYAALGIAYPLEGVPPIRGEELAAWNRRLNEVCCPGAAQGTHRKETDCNEH